MRLRPGLISRLASLPRDGAEPLGTKHRAGTDRAETGSWGAREGLHVEGPQAGQRRGDAEGGWWRPAGRETRSPGRPRCHHEPTPFLPV